MEEEPKDTDLVLQPTRFEEHIEESSQDFARLEHYACCNIHALILYLIRECGLHSHVLRLCSSSLCETWPAGEPLVDDEIAGTARSRLLMRYMRHIA